MKTTKKQFDYFKQRCLYWRDKLGLRGWCLTFKYGTDDDDQYYAHYAMDGGARNIIVSFTSEWAEEDNLSLNNTNIDRVAFHECCEMLIQELANVALDRGASPDYITDLKHGIVRTLENLLYE